MLTLEQKSVNFINMINEAAERLSSRFFIEIFEGHDMLTDTLYCEDFSGWLVPNDKQTEFPYTNNRERQSAKWDEYFCFAEWRQVGNDIKIDFKKYPIYT